ncbi:hypothetical protein EDB89DRAFT_2007550, partial [Lactarius sanguifluus]
MASFYTSCSRHSKSRKTRRFHPTRSDCNDHSESHRSARILPLSKSHRAFVLSVNSDADNPYRSTKFRQHLLLVSPSLRPHFHCLAPALLTSTLCSVTSRCKDTSGPGPEIAHLRSMRTRTVVAWLSCPTYRSRPPTASHFAFAPIDLSLVFSSHTKLSLPLVRYFHRHYPPSSHVAMDANTDRLAN